MISRTHPASIAPKPASLERQAIGFTIGLYLFIAFSLLALHYLAPMLPQAIDIEQPSTLGSETSSPHTTVATEG